MRERGANGDIAGGEIGLEIDHAVARHRIGDAPNLQGAMFLAVNFILHMGIGLVGNDDFARGRLMLHPGGEVHRAPDHGVVHPVGTAEIADRAIVGVDADPAPQRLLDSGVAPYACELRHPALHRDRHLDAGKRVLLDAAGFRVAEEHHDRVADIFVDRGAVLRRDLRHLREVMIEQLREVFRFHPVGGFGKAGAISEKQIVNFLRWLVIRTS